MRFISGLLHTYYCSLKLVFMSMETVSVAVLAWDWGHSLSGHPQFCSSPPIFVCGRGSAPNPVGGDYRAPPLLSWWVGGSLPLSKNRRPALSPSGHAAAPRFCSLEPPLERVQLLKKFTKTNNTHLYHQHHTHMRCRDVSIRNLKTVKTVSTTTSVFQQFSILMK